MCFILYKITTKTTNSFFNSHIFKTTLFNSKWCNSTPKFGECTPVWKWQLFYNNFCFKTIFKKSIRSEFISTSTNKYTRGRRDRNRMVVGFTTTCAISAYHHYSCEFEPRSIQHYVIKLVSNLRQVGGFLLVLRFPPPIKLTATI